MGRSRRAHSLMSATVITTNAAVSAGWSMTSRFMRAGRLPRCVCAPAALGRRGAFRGLAEGPRHADGPWMPIKLTPGFVSVT